MGAADASGDAEAGDELVEVAAVGDVDDVDALDEAGDVDDLDVAGDVARLAAGVVRAGELCALANGNGPSASIAMARNGTVDFMRTLSLF
jgi:hypothetical protein